MSCRPCPRAGCWQQGPLPAARGCPRAGRAVPARTPCLLGPPARFWGRAGSPCWSLAADTHGHLRLLPSTKHCPQERGPAGPSAPTPRPHHPARSLRSRALPCRGAPGAPPAPAPVVLGACGPAAGLRRAAGAGDDATAASTGVWGVGREERFLSRGASNRTCFTLSLELRCIGATFRIWVFGCTANTFAQRHLPLSLDSYSCCK